LKGARLSREAGFDYVLELMLRNLGFAALAREDVSAATPLLAEALRIAGEIDDRVGQMHLLNAFAWLAMAAAHAKLAAQLLGAADGIRQGTGASAVGFLQPRVEEARTRAAGQLGAARFASEVGAGNRMGREAAMRLALGERLTTAAASQEPDELAGRESEVAGLVAEGLSNKQIGARLLISERTVEGHVRGILNKLGFNSRAQIAGWVRAAEANQ